MTAVGDLVRVEREGGIATITLDSQHNRNALSRQLLHELNDALEAPARSRRSPAGVARSLTADSLGRLSAKARPPVRTKVAGAVL